MNREQLVEKARAAIDAEAVDPDDAAVVDYDAWLRTVAAAVVDAVLPQITTAEQLDRYSEGTHLIGGEGVLWTLVGPYLTDGEREALLIAEALERFGPLTVVWAA